MRNISQDEAIQLLEGEKVGTFLVRPSSDPRALGTITHVAEDGISNIRLAFSGDLSKMTPADRAKLLNEEVQKLIDSKKWGLTDFFQ